VNPSDYIILAGFFAVMLGVGVFYANRMKTLTDFFGGSRQVPWWLAGTSLYMTTFSAFTFVSYSALAYQNGIVAMTIWWFSIPGCVLSAKYLASRWRRAATTSPLEYLETRYSPFLRQCFSWFGVPLIVLDDALKLFVIGTMITFSLGLEGESAQMWAIAGCGAIMLAYTLLGGIWAVMITDFVQFVVMAAAVLVLAPLAASRAGGLATAFDALPAEALQFTSGTYTWPWLLSFAFILSLTFATKWPYVQRYYAARSEPEARRVGYLVAGLTFIGPPLLFWPALAARVFMPGIEDPNAVYPLLCRELLPAGMMGIVIAAMFSATMSMLSSDYNAAASVVTNDILKRLVMRDASPKTLVRTARLATLGIGLSAMGLALLLARAEGLEDLVKIMARLFAVLLPPTALPMAAGLLSSRVSGAGGIAGFAAGATCGIAAYTLSYAEGYGFLAQIQYLTWITTIPTALGLAVGSLAVPDTPSKQESVRLFLQGLTGQLAPEPKALGSDEAAMALRVVGITCVAMGLLLAGTVLATAGFSGGRISIGVGGLLAAGGAAACAWPNLRKRMSANHAP